MDKTKNSSKKLLFLILKMPRRHSARSTARHSLDYLSAVIASVLTISGDLYRVIYGRTIHRKSSFLSIRSVTNKKKEGKKNKKQLCKSASESGKAKKAKSI